MMISGDGAAAYVWSFYLLYLQLQATSPLSNNIKPPFVHEAYFQLHHK